MTWLEIGSPPISEKGQTTIVKIHQNIQTKWVKEVECLRTNFECKTLNALPFLAHGLPLQFVLATFKHNVITPPLPMEHISMECKGSHLVIEGEGQSLIVPLSS